MMELGIYQAPIKEATIVEPRITLLTPGISGLPRAVRFYCDEMNHIA
jgi:hypothetical protein